MLVSDKQHEANRQNAQHSTGPKTEEGKAAVRLNALTYGLRARSLLITGEDPEDYKRLWASFEAEWQPRTFTERLHLEQMATSQWLLARIATAENSIYEAEIEDEKRFALLDRAFALRLHLERSFRNAMHDLEHLQQKRQARRQQQPAQTVPSPQPPAPSPGERSAPPVPHSGQVMPEGNEDHPVFCAPVTPDTR